MARISNIDKRFGEIAMDMQLVSQDKLDRALVVQKVIFSRTKVHMPLGKVLKEMGVLTQEQIETILEAQKKTSSNGEQDNAGNADGQCGLPADKAESEDHSATLSLTIAKDKLSAFIFPTKYAQKGLTLEDIKNFLQDRSVVHGLVEDQALSAYLAQDPLPREPFKVAAGTPPTPGKPPEIIYHFDTDPLLIGTLQEDGTMDWKDRGQIPQVKAGDVLVEKTGGKPGRPGTSVCGKELPPPRLRNPKLKCGKGAQRSEEGHQILAKIDGLPKLSADGKVYVFNMLSIDGDIGVETGHIEFDGCIEATGGVTSGYTVKGKELSTAEIQDAVIEMEENLVCHGGVYGSKIKVGGSLKAKHIHNCTIEVIGEMVVKKEIYDCVIETNSRCLVVDGKLIDSKIDAKKGVYAKNIGSEGSNPCELTVGFDRKYERDMADYKAQKDELARQMADAQALHPKICQDLDAIGKQIGALAREKDNFKLQKKQFEEQLRGEGPNPLDEDDEEERTMLEDMISELEDNNEKLDARVKSLIDKEDKARAQADSVENRIQILATQIEEIKEKMEILETSQKVDPGIAEVKVHGTIYSNTAIKGPRREIIISEDMHRVRIAETKVDPDSNRYQMKISNLR